MDWKKLIIVLLFLPAITFGQIDPSLQKDIESWKPGMRAPAKLLKFPDGKLQMGALCGFGEIGDRLQDVIGKISNPDLLEELIFDPQADSDTLKESMKRLLRLKGIPYTRVAVKKHMEMIAEQAARLQADLNADSEVPVQVVVPGGPRAEIATYVQVLNSPFITCKVARVRADAAPTSAALEALDELKALLDKGVPWKEAYREVSEAHPEKPDPQFPKVHRTKIGYLLDAVISPVGYDPLDERLVELPPRHIKKLFEVKSGNHVMEANGVCYLYHITDFAEPGF